MINDLRFVDYFLFTQHSLSTFDNCHLKFKKRYLEGLKWDSFPDEKVKKRLEMGNNFHLLAQRYFLGIDTGLDRFTEEFGELNGWIDNLKKKFKFENNTTYLPEYKLRMITPSMKLEANFDLLAIKEDSIQIWDWKTHGKASQGIKSFENTKLKNSLQTMVYMYVLKEQAQLVAGKKIECGKISMLYWQPDPSGIQAQIDYSDELHERFGEIIQNKIKSILEYDYDCFNKEEFRKHCKFCEFNWFCNNERVNFSEETEDGDLLDDIDWDSVEERY